MYGHSYPMNIPAQIAGSGADDDISASASAGNHHSVSYDAHPLEDGVQEVATDPIYVTSAAASASDLAAVQLVDGTCQLSLSFCGQVYVFDAITPDKFHAVLLLLGGCELTSGPHVVEMSSQKQRDAGNKGQFTSSKKYDGAYSWGTSQDDDNLLDTLCMHCGISSKSTLMMQRGQSGPRSLCNAWGLFWANKGTLRDIPKKTQDHSLTPVEQGESEANDRF